LALGEFQPPTLDGFSSLSGGGVGICGLKSDDGRVMCWGSNDGEPPAATAFASIALERTQSCGVREADSKIECWPEHASAAAFPPTGAEFSFVDGPCGLRATDGVIECWGPLYVIGDADADTEVPTAVALASFDQGALHGCAIRQSDSGVTCWGYDSLGETDPPAGAFRSVAAGFFSSCGVRSSGKLKCWGAGGDFGQSEAPGDTPYVALSIGAFLCAIREADHAAQCWGADGLAVAPPSAEVPFAKIAVGDGSACGIRADDDTVQCWGRNAAGESEPPADVAFADVSTGGYSSCGIRKTDRKLQCWGNEDPSRATSPVGTYKSVSVGSDSSCAIRDDNGLEVCWGGMARNLWR
jgi:hypothetical protein